MAEFEEQKINKVVEQLNKKFGLGKVVVPGLEVKVKHPTLKSGSLNLDYALNGGYAKGRIIEIFGAESSGKTTLAIHAMVEVQKSGGTCGFIDMEHSFNFDYAETLGLDVNKIFFSQPDNGEESFTIAEELINSGLVDTVVFDSVAAMIPKAELDGEFGESKMGLQARMMSQGMRKLTGLSSKKNVMMIFINQTRVKLGVMFGDPTTTTGGEALKFYSTQRIHCSGSTKIKNSDQEIIGNKVVAKIVKNKIGSPHMKAEFNLIYGKGIDSLGEIIDIAISYEVINKKGSWYSYGETKLGQGDSQLRDCLEDNPELLEEIKQKCGL